MPLPTGMQDLSTTAASNSPAGGDPIGTSLDNYLREIQAIIRHTNAKGADIASAATTNIAAATGEFVTVTGTTTITALGTIDAGIVRVVHFSGALTLTHNATSLILPGAQNYVTSAGDVLAFRSLGSGNWRCVGVTRASSGIPTPVTVATVAAMKALTGLVGDEAIKTLCYSVTGKGAGTYRASTTVVTENGGTKINNNAGTITYHLIHDGRVDITQFGALVDNSTNDHVAIQACLDAADSEDFTPTHNGGVSRIAAKLTVPAFVKFKGHGNFRKNGNIDMCELANGACVEDISWDGRGATYTGRGIIVSAQGDQKIHDCDITDMDGYCVEYVGDGTAPGIRSTIRGGVQYRTNVSDPAIKYPDDVLNGNRSMVDIHSAGGVMADFGGGENILVYGCNTDNFDYSDAPRKVALVCNRIATSGANLIIDGQEHITVGNLIAGQVELTSGTNNCVIGPDVSIGALIDNSGVSNNKVYGHYAEFTPVWEAATTNPTLGNGTITGRMTRDGRRANFVIELTMGSTTTFGTGAYSFKLPSPYDAWTVRRSIGNVRALDSGTNFRTGVAITVTGVFSVSLYSDAGTAAWGPTNPFTFAVNDTIIIDVDCELT